MKSLWCQSVICTDKEPDRRDGGDDLLLKSVNKMELKTELWPAFVCSGAALYPYNFSSPTMIVMVVFSFYAHYIFYFMH